MAKQFFSFLASQYINLTVAFAALLFIIVLGELIINAYKRESKSLAISEATAKASVLRARIERELNTILYLNSGLSSYLVVRHNDIHDTEITDILSVLHRSSRYVRNFGVAVGYRLTYVYPYRGNESVVGMDYRTLESQWPIIEAIIKSGKPALDGPVQLVQGGNGLIYRVPLLINNQYWGLLSTVIDMDRLMQSVFDLNTDDHDWAAVRSRPQHSDVTLAVLGDQHLFSHSAAVIQQIDVPGGVWMVAVRADKGYVSSSLFAILRLVSILLGMLIAWLVYMLMQNRAELAVMALFDNLTGLPNRRMLEDRHQQVLARMRRHPDIDHALLFLDLDRFKAINDTHGHKAGDAVLKEIANRLRRTMRTNDTVARWGGDEFIVLLEGINPKACGALLQRLYTIIAQPICFADYQLDVGGSIGVVFYPNSEITLDELLKLADQEMYRDKERRRQ